MEVSKKQNKQNKQREAPLEMLHSYSGIAQIAIGLKGALWCTFLGRLEQIYQITVLTYECLKDIYILFVTKHPVEPNTLRTQAIPDLNLIFTA